jgi:hypothetical protein
LGECTQVKRTANLFDAAKASENVRFYPLSKTNSFIDALYRKGNIFYGIQATTGESHSFSPIEMQEWVNLARNSVLNGKFHLHYLVLHDNLNRFTLKVKDGERKNKIHENEYNQWLIYAIGAREPPELVNQDVIDNPESETIELRID